MTPLDLVLIIGATARLVHLAQQDTILDTPRGRLHDLIGSSKTAELLWCPLCLSIWIAAAVAATWAAWADHTWWTAATAALTASMATGLLARWEER